MSTSRLRVSDDLLAQVMRSLTERDRLLCRLVFEHSVLTTDQIADVGFETLPRAQVRLLRLHQLRVLNRFRPYRSSGSAPFHYVLGEMGAALVAAERGIEASELGYRTDRAMAWAASPRLAHLVGVNGVFTSLMGTARRSGGVAALEEWWSERHCAKAMAGVVNPDGYGVWREAGSTIEFCLEYDRGTERGSRLAAKLSGYADLEAATRVRRWVLFRFAGPRREAEVRRGLRTASVPVATATAGVAGPADAIWLPVGEEGPRRRLAQLAEAGIGGRDPSRGGLLTWLR